MGWLDAHAHEQPPDLIVANPTYIEPGQTGPGHVEAIIRSAAIADYEGRWTFDVDNPAAIRHALDRHVYWPVATDFQLTGRALPALV